MSELVPDERKVLISYKTYRIDIVPATNNFKNDALAIEWAEIFKPEPKPDANGWFKLSVDCKPELLQNVMLLKDNNLVWRTWQGEPNKIVVWRTWQGEPSLFAYDYWKPFVGPVDAS